MPFMDRHAPKTPAENKHPPSATTESTAVATARPAPSADWILPIVLDVLLWPQAQPKIRLTNLFDTLAQVIAVAKLDPAFR
jgi:hypothetical protein